MFLFLILIVFIEYLSIKSQVFPDGLIDHFMKETESSRWGHLRGFVGFLEVYTPWLWKVSQTSGPLTDRPPGATRGPYPLVINTRLCRTGEPLN